MKKDSLFLYEKTPAARWEESFLLGNGTLGASVFGATKNERIILNHDTLWSGYPRKGVAKGSEKEALDRAKQLVREKRYYEADKLISKDFASYAVDSYLPMGELSLTFPEAEKPSAYKRTLDLANALCASEYRIGDVGYKTQSFISHPDNAMVWRTDSNGGKFSLTVGLTSQLYSRVYTEGTTLFLEGEATVTSEQNVERTDRKTLYCDEPEKRGIRYACAVGVITDGAVKGRGNAIAVGGATFVELRIVAETSFNGADKHPFLDGKPYAENCRASLKRVMALNGAEMLAHHVADHKKYFSRVSLDLGTSNKSRTPTSKRLADHQAGVEDKALIPLLFNFGRYLTIAGSRKGSQAMNLQGIWNPHFFAPWHSNYTVNINTQMNYFPTLMVGLPEMYQPLIELIEGVSKNGTESARDFYGADGWVCHHNTDLWRATNPVAGNAQWLFWNACGAWLCHHLMEYYEYTLDERFLRKKAYPIMRECARFYLSQLDDAEDGSRILFPSTSPENKFACEGGASAVSETTEMTMACLRELFGNIIKVSELIGITDEITDSVRAEYPRLRKPTVGSDGRLLEWYGEMPEIEIRHRHVSHMYGLHPAHEITPVKTPELAEACRKTLAVRGDDGTGWSLAWKCNFFARLWDGDHALLLLKNQLRVCGTQNTVYTVGGGSYPNLMCAHPPFQIDGNFGAVSGIAEMLLQSDVDTVHIIPALPTEWKDVTVSGLRAKGKRKVSFKVKDGKLIEYKITGTPPKKVLVAGKEINQ